MAKVGGSPIAQALPLSSIDYNKISDECRERAELIMRAKGSTPYGIGSVVASTCTSILMDKRNIRPLSHFQPEFGCCFSLPALIGKQGIIGAIHMPLNDEEKAKISDSATKLKRRLETIREDS
jgi:L-lactate dehydrogenase